MPTQLTEGQQNQLIIDHTEIVVPVVAEFRGQKSIPFEELVAEGMATLVAAARVFRPDPRATFATYATRAIRYAVRDFIDRWQEFDALDEISVDDEDRIHEWALWGSLPSEGWTSLASTPEEILWLFQEFDTNRAAISSALISLDARERKIVEAFFLREPRVKIDQIARDHKLSYRQTIYIIYCCTKKMRDVVSRIAKNQSGVSRKGRLAAPRDRGLPTNIIPFKAREPAAR